MRVLSFIYSHRLSGILEILIGFDPKPEKESESRKVSRNASVGRSALVLSQPSTDTNREQPSYSRSTGRSTVPCHGWLRGRPRYFCACHARRSTGQSTGLVHQSTGVTPWPVVCVILAPFIFRSLCYLPLSHLSPLSLHTCLWQWWTTFHISIKLEFLMPGKEDSACEHSGLVYSSQITYKIIKRFWRTRTWCIAHWLIK